MSQGCENISKIREFEYRALSLIYQFSGATEKGLKKVANFLNRDEDSVVTRSFWLSYASDLGLSILAGYVGSQTEPGLVNDILEFSKYYFGFSVGIRSAISIFTDFELYVPSLHGLAIETLTDTMFLPRENSNKSPKRKPLNELVKEEGVSQ